MKVLKAGAEIVNKLDGKEVLKSIERVGRTCYKSEDLITEDSAERFVKSIISRGHESVIEHINITVRFICDRGISHEIVRHRIASYAQESSRYCNYSKDKFGGEITYIDLLGHMDNKQVYDMNLDLFREWVQACKDAERHYFKMLEYGATPEIARSVLNNSTKTELVATMNLRSWRNFFKLRCDKAAHPQMREIAVPLLKEFKELIPIVFDDIDA